MIYTKVGIEFKVLSLSPEPSLKGQGLWLSCSACHISTELHLRLIQYKAPSIFSYFSLLVLLRHLGLSLFSLFFSLNNILKNCVASIMFHLHIMKSENFSEILCSMLHQHTFDIINIVLHIMQSLYLITSNKYSIYQMTSKFLYTLGKRKVFFM